MKPQRSFTSAFQYLKSMKHLTDVSSIKGNVDYEMKQAAYTLFKYFVSTPEKSYGAAVGQRLSLVEVNVWGQGTSSWSQTTFEVAVTKGTLSLDILQN